MLLASRDCLAEEELGLWGATSLFSRAFWKSTFPKAAVKQPVPVSAGMQLILFTKAVMMPCFGLRGKTKVGNTPKLKVCKRNVIKENRFQNYARTTPRVIVIQIHC